jgi:hypothetical protein
MDWGSAWWAGLTLFEKLMWCIAVPSTILTLLQLAMEVLGFGGHGLDGDASGGLGHLDAHVDHAGQGQAHAGAGLQIFSVRGVIFFFTAFSWLGIVGVRAGLSILFASAVGLVSGFAFMLLFAWVFFVMNKLEESGNFQIKNALYQHGQVYLHIPGKRAAAGKVTVEVQGVLREIHAVTDGEDIPTGAAVQVVDIVDDETVLVAQD